jgi:type VI secretion system lysozyme-like protein
VQHSVESLLNTRRNLGVWREDDDPRTTLSYGVGDLTGLSSENPAVRKRAAGEIAEALTAFEPRLSRIEVAPEQALDRRGRVSITLQAVLVVGSVQVPVRWDVKRFSDRLEIREALNGP